ncbi:anti-sigma factor [Paenibacillus sp. FSL K6-0276]|uniref:anti-sigma factor n=1 Tax=Paenibacillus sp. FSL K6-0276 TaxID=2921450 RepID=UPI0030EFA07F
MSEEFKEKLRRYGEGTLADEDRDEVERELEKMEVYQTYLDELMGAEEPASGDGKRMNFGKGEGSRPNREKKIIRRGKWRARVSSTLTVISALLMFMIICSFITAIFYGTGERVEKYRDVVSSAIAVSQPNTIVHLSNDSTPFFSMNLTGDIRKQVGDEQITVGDYSMKLLFGWARLYNYSWTDESRGVGYYFVYPQGKQSAANSMDDSSEWERLEKLPEGTVAEAYLSFDQLFTTDELLKKFEPKNLQPLWFAADTGPRTREPVINDPLGFPSTPIWHADDMKVTQESKKKWGWFGGVTSRTSVSPSVDSYGDAELRNANFLKTLHLMQEYKSIANKVIPFIDLDDSISYLEKNGVKLYGAVVTGPVKELLKLKEEEWVSNMHVGEVRLWNWRDREN